MIKVSITMGWGRGRTQACMRMWPKQIHVYSRWHRLQAGAAKLTQARGRCDSWAAYTTQGKLLTQINAWIAACKLHDTSARSNRMDHSPMATKVPQVAQDSAQSLLNTPPRQIRSSWREMVLLATWRTSVTYL